MVTRVRRDVVRPSYQTGVARSAGESANPNAWKGLVGLWIPALGPTGSNLFDLSPIKGHGVLTNMDAATDWRMDPLGEWGYVLNFDDSDDYINIPDNQLPTSEISIVVICKLAATGVNYAVVERRITYGIRVRGGNNNFAAVLGTDDDPADFGAETINNDLVANIWYHIAITYRTGDNRIFRNGLQEAVVTTITGDLSYAAAGTDPLRIGSAPSTAATDFADDIAYVALYDRVLSPDEIWQQYQDPMAIVRPREMGRVAFDQVVAGGDIRNHIIPAYMRVNA